MTYYSWEDHHHRYHFRHILGGIIIKASTYWPLFCIIIIFLFQQVGIYLLWKKKLIATLFWNNPGNPAVAPSLSAFMQTNNLRSRLQSSLLCWNSQLRSNESTNIPALLLCGCWQINLLNPYSPSSNDPGLNRSIIIYYSTIYYSTK